MLPVPSFAPVGSSGLYAPGGRLVRREPNRELAVDIRAYGSSTELGLFEKYAKTVPSCSQSVKGAVLPVASAMLNAQVTPADGKARDRKGTQLLDPHAEFVHRALFEDLKPGFARYFREATRTAVINGFSLSEVVCRYDKARKQITLDKLAPRPPWTIYRWLFTGGVLTGVQQQSYNGSGFASEVLSIDSLLVHTLDPNGDDPTGSSWLRPCHMPAKLVLDGLKLLGIWCDREALGVPVATVPKGMVKGDKEDVDEFLANLRAHESSFGRFPEGVDIAWKQGNPDGGRAISDAIDFLDRQIRSTFLQSMQSMGTTPNGSLAAASAMTDPWVLAEEGLGADILEPINSQLIPALVSWNFGPQPAYPYISAPKLRAEDVAAALAPLTAASTAGLTVKRAATERAHELLGLPAPEAEAVAAPVAAPGAVPAAPAPDAAAVALNGAQVTSLVDLVSQVAAGTLPRDSAIEITQLAFNVDAPTADRLLGSAGRGFVPKVEEKPAAAPAPAQLHSERAPWTPRRPLLAGEGAVRFAEIGAKLDAAPADLAAGVTKAVQGEREAVTAWLAGLRKAADAGDFKAINAADVPPGLRKALTDATAGYAGALYRFGHEHAEAELALAPGRAEAAARASQAATREDIADPAAEPLKLAAEDEQDDSAAVPLDDPEDPGLDALARGQGDALADEILRTARAKAIRDAKARKAAKLPPIDLDEEALWNDFVTSVEEAPAIKRTAMELSVEGNSAGRAAFMREAESEGVLYPVLYSALLDSGTCGPCREADGTIADSVAGADAGQIPASPNPGCESTKGRYQMCRCLRVLQPSKQ